MSDNYGFRDLMGKQQLLDAARSEHSAAVFFGDDQLVTAAREKAHQQLDAVLDAQEAQIIGHIKRLP